MAKAPHLRRPDDTHLRQQWDTVEENELGIPRAAAERIVGELNEDLSTLYILFNQVRKHRWLVEGAESGQVDDFLEDAADRLSTATDDLAIRVVELGGIPVCGPMGMRQHASTHIEAGNVYDLRTSLQNDLDGYTALVVGMRDTIELADSVGDAGTVDLVRDHLRTVEEDAHTVERYLADDTLVRDSATR